MDDVLTGATGMLHAAACSTSPRRPPPTPLDYADIEASVSVAGVVTLQAHDQGTKIGKAYGASIGTDTTANIELLPELN